MDKSNVCEESHVCQPIHTVEDLLQFEQNPVRWRNLVLPITPRSKSRHLGDRYQEIDFDNGIVEFVEDRQRPQVLLCHDFKGNYLADRYINGTTGEQWVDYRFYNWAAVDVFCYFSHNFVTIPTLQWLNCAHKNGVRVIGTFIIEGGNVTLLKEILKSSEFLKKVADALVTVAKVCQFQGWLLNIECTLESEKIPLLKEFVSYLTSRSHEQIPDSEIIWYDAITEQGLLSWQNELNSQNKCFFEACDGIFLNYTWSRLHLERTENLIRNHFANRKLDVYVGIDVFGRGQKAKLDTHATLAAIMEFKFSVAIFAPGWTFESLEDSMRRDQLDQESSNLRFLKLNDRFWNLLWRYFFVRGPQQLPFYTSFCLGSGKIRNRLGKQQSESWFNLSRQRFQPSIPYTPPKEYEHDNVGPVYWTHSFDTALDGGSCVKLEEAHPNCRLFACDFACDSDLIVSYAFQRSNPASADVCVLLKAYNRRYHDSLKIVCGSDECHLSGRRNEMKANLLTVEDCRTLLKLKADVKLPAMTDINGWEIRYYYLSFESHQQPVSLVDIGIEIWKDHPKDYILLGAVSLQAGFPASRTRIAKRTNVSFDM
ncbi:cytosolic endo-beta-N-acetylglucosaminidase [Sabethes cyaneus]|uniref:cytosolic endo-beta-N-acetylglucosaminidase n=1 Tax=Sabethes cyaneus TaxID=53552 RepID=UPI00237E5012|nr:cytosolic endo-beta-N-acetylglucosaminidase [Sabethes cyaneus]